MRRAEREQDQGPPRLGPVGPTPKIRKESRGASLPAEVSRDGADVTDVTGGTSLPAEVAPYVPATSTSGTGTSSRAEVALSPFSENHLESLGPCSLFEVPLGARESLRAVGRSRFAPSACRMSPALSPWCACLCEVLRGDGVGVNEQRA